MTEWKMIKFYLFFLLDDDSEAHIKDLKYRH